MHLRVEGLEADIAPISNRRPSQYQSNEEYDEHTNTLSALAPTERDSPNTLLEDCGIGQVRFGVWLCLLDSQTLG